MSEGNGHDTKGTARLELTFDLLGQQMTIKGEVPCFDTALDMLGRATRHFEAAQRLQLAKDLAREQSDVGRMQSILERARGRA